MLPLADYDYELPRSLIAQHPPARRSDARLLLVDRAREAIEHYHIRDLPGLLRASDTLVLNDTRVIPARLVGYRASTGGRWEGLFLSADAQGNWRLLAKTRGKLEPGEAITLVNERLQDALSLRLLIKEEGAPGLPGRTARRNPWNCWKRWAASRCPPIFAAAKWRQRTGSATRPSTPTHPAPSRHPPRAALHGRPAQAHRGDGRGDGAGHAARGARHVPAGGRG